MTFNAAAQEATSPVPLYAYPRWFTTLRYCINFLKSHERKGKEEEPSEKYKRGAMATVERLFSFACGKELKTLSDAAIKYDLIRESLSLSDTLRDRIEIVSSGPEKKGKVDAKEADELHYRKLADFLDKIDGLMDKVASHLKPASSNNFKNMKMIADLYGLSSLECETLAFHVDERLVARLLTVEAEDTDCDGYDQGYSQTLALCLGLYTVDDSDDDPTGSITYKIQQLLFQKKSLTEAGLLFEVEGFRDSDCFVTDVEISGILQSNGISEASLLEKFIGKRVTSKLRWDINFKYIPWNQEIINYTTGAMHRLGMLGKSILFEGEPGSGKSTGVPALAATIEDIMHHNGQADYEVPVYVIGVGSENTSSVKKGQYRRDEESSGANNAADADIRKLIRARYLLAKWAKPAFLVVEEADGVVATLVAEKGGAITRAMCNYILEHSPVPTFYITNHPEKFDTAARRRFIDYKMIKPPQNVRVDMIADIGKAYGLTIHEKDAITLASHYEFMPGVIESALLMLRDIKHGQAMLEGKKISEGAAAVSVSLQDLKMCFERKQVGLVGTNLQLIEKLKIPEKLDIDLYYPSHISQADLRKLAEGAGKPRLWLLAGLPSTEVTELALFAAKKTGREVEIIDLKSLNADFHARLETAVTYKRPVVIIGAEGLFNIENPLELESMPAMKALKNHVQNNGFPVYIVAHAPPSAAPNAIQNFFSGEGCGYAGFNLAIADQLLMMINKLSGQDFEPELIHFLGLACAGPADVRKALAMLNGNPRSFTTIADTLDRMVPHAVTRKELEYLTGIKIKDDQPTHH